MTIHDITLPLTDDLACWPETSPYRFLPEWQMSASASVNIGTASLGLHMGTHADAPFHFLPDGATIDEVSLTPFLGPARLIDVSGKTSISVADLGGFDFSGTPRLLLRTNAWTDLTRFPEKIPVMDADVPQFLQAHGVVLIGLDVPSVDALDSKDLANHHALAAAGIAILESLLLTGVPEGEYELLALPLKLVGADAAPVRAILRSLTPTNEFMG